MAKLRFGIKTAPMHTTYEAMLACYNARIPPDMLFDRLRNLEKISARDLTAAE